MCHYLGGGLHGRQKRVKAQSESSKSVVNSVLISREMPVFPGFLEIIRVVELNLKYGHSPVSWDMLYNMVMFVPFGVIYCYYQKNFRVYKAVGMSCLTTFFIESAQLVLKTGVVDIDDLIVNTLGSLTGIVVYVILQQISFKNQKFEIHELIDISATMLPPMFVAFIAEMFLGDGSLKLLPVHCVVLLCYGIFVYVFLIRDFTRKAKVYYLACYVGAFYLSRVLL